MRRAVFRAALPGARDVRGAGYKTVSLSSLPACGRLRSAPLRPAGGQPSGTQLLSTSQSVLAVPDVLPHFPKVRYAVAYGSSAFQQAGYPVKHGSMVDYIFAVDSPSEWHRENLEKHPSHYSWLGSFGATVVGAVQDKFASGVYYNTLVDWGDRRIKYGVVSTARLQEDLHGWTDLYIAGRMHKPVITLRDDPELIRPAVQANLEHGLRAALLLLPEKFSEKQLFRTVAGLSYLGDWRMQVGENPDKVANIVDSNMGAFQTLYADQLAALQLQRAGAMAAEATEAAANGEGPSMEIRQDTSPQSRAELLALLPAPVVRGIAAAHGGLPDSTAAEISELAARPELAGSPRLGAAVKATIGGIVRRSSWRQSAKGLLSAGLGKVASYLYQKWQTGRRTRAATKAAKRAR